MTTTATAADVLTGLPIQVQSVGWSFTSFGVWALVALMTPIIVALLKFWPTMVKTKHEADGSLRHDLMAEVKQLRKELRAEQAECVRRTTGMQNKMDDLVRQFVSFQIIVSQSLPVQTSPAVTESAQKLMDIISRPLEDFMPPALPVEEEAGASG